MPAPPVLILRGNETSNHITSLSDHSDNLTFFFFLYLFFSNSISKCPMSHPAASIKSIFSGKVNFTDTDLDDSSNRSDSGSYINSGQTNYSYDERSDFKPDSEYDLKTSYDLKNPNSPDARSQYAAPKTTAYLLEYEGEPSLDHSHDVTSVLLKNLRIMALQKGPGSDFYPLQSSSTNISLASSGSDYQQVYIRDTDAYSSDSSQLEPAPDGVSRPWSRNSNTSCLSTTATKDGIEGKRLHRMPYPYSGRPEEDPDALGLPPVTLKEKIGLLNPDPRQRG